MGEFMMEWIMLHPNMTPGHLGLLPWMLDENDPRDAREQFNERYAHGGGWHPMGGFKLNPNNSLKYPGDPVLEPLAHLQFRNELIVFYDSSWVAIIQKDRTFEVCRMD
jgi:hypothetical protein